jgi:hypothetical protein
VIRGNEASVRGLHTRWGWHRLRWQHRHHRCIVEDNDADVHGGGLWCRDNTTIIDCLIRNNDVYYGNDYDAYGGAVAHCDDNTQSSTPSSSTMSLALISGT